MIRIIPVDHIFLSAYIRSNDDAADGCDQEVFAMSRPALSPFVNGFPGDMALNRSLSSSDFVIFLTVR